MVHGGPLVQFVSGVDQVVTWVIYQMPLPAQRNVGTHPILTSILRNVIYFDREFPENKSEGLEK